MKLPTMPTSQAVAERLTGGAPAFVLVEGQTHLRVTNIMVEFLGKGGCRVMAKSAAGELTISSHDFKMPLAPGDTLNLTCQFLMPVTLGAS